MRYKKDFTYWVIFILISIIAVGIGFYASINNSKSEITTVTTNRMVNTPKMTNQNNNINRNTYSNVDLNKSSNFGIANVDSEENISENSNINGDSLVPELQETTCIDSDANQESDGIYTKGNVVYTDEWGQESVLYDECNSIGNQVNEYKCSENSEKHGNFMTEIKVYDCLNGCLDGACIDTTTSEDWHEYINTEYNYSLKYFNTWTLLDNLGDEVKILPPGITEDSPSAPHKSIILKHATKEEARRMINIKYIEIDDVIALQGQKSEFTISKATFIPIPNSLGNYIEVYWDKSNSNNVYDQTLTSFQFIPTAPVLPPNTTEWETYTNELYGFSLKFPPSWKGYIAEDVSGAWVIMKFTHPRTRSSDWEPGLVYFYIEIAESLDWHNGPERGIPITSVNGIDYEYTPSTNDRPGDLQDFWDQIDDIILTFKVINQDYWQWRL